MPSVDKHLTFESIDPSPCWSLPAKSSQGQPYVMKVGTFEKLVKHATVSLGLYLKTTRGLLDNSGEIIFAADKQFQSE